MILKKTFSFILLSLFVALSSCKKDKEEPLENLDVYFDINSKDFPQDPFVFPPDAAFFLDNKSTADAVSAWDFGNGKKSDQQKPMASYGDIGTYKIKLNISKGNQSKSLEKTVLIKDRKAYEMQVMVDKWNTQFYHDIDWADDKKADVFVRIYRQPRGGNLPKIVGEAFDAELYYESAVLKDVSLSPNPLFIPLTKDLYVQHPQNKFDYGYCLYATSDGKEHLLSSSWGSGVGIVFNEDYRTRISQLETGFPGTRIIIKAGY